MLIEGFPVSFKIPKGYSHLVKYNGDGIVTIEMVKNEQ
jgi:hypothetical protein